MKTLLALMASVTLAGPAYAQYYAPPPPPPGYYSPYRARIGGRCSVVYGTPYGQRRLVCPITDPKPVGEACACPLPPQYPGGPLGPYAGGRTIR